MTVLGPGNSRSGVSKRARQTFEGLLVALWILLCCAVLYLTAHF